MAFSTAKTTNRGGVPRPEVLALVFATNSIWVALESTSALAVEIPPLTRALISESFTQVVPYSETFQSPRPALSKPPMATPAILPLRPSGSVKLLPPSSAPKVVGVAGVVAMLPLALRVSSTPFKVAPALKVGASLDGFSVIFTMAVVDKAPPTPCALFGWAPLPSMKVMAIALLPSVKASLLLE